MYYVVQCSGGGFGSDVGHINEVALRPARIVLGM